MTEADKTLSVLNDEAVEQIAAKLAEMHGMTWRTGWWWRPTRQTLRDVTAALAEARQSGFDDGFAAARANPEYVSGNAYRKNFPVKE